MTISRPVLVLLLAGLAGLAAFPLVGEEFYVELVVRLMIFGIFAMSLDLLIGFTGLISFGHAAFFGLAGYALAIVTPETEAISIFWALPASLAATALAALVVGWFSVRTSGIYFIMITLAFAQMMYYFFNENSALGSSDGKFISFRPEVAIGGVTLFDLDDPLVLYYFVLASLIAVYVLLTILLRAPFGRVVRGIRTNEGRTRALGFNTRRYKLVSFVIAGTIAGFAGFLEATHTGLVSPAHLSWHESGLIMMIVILGGSGTLYGPVLGAFAMGLLEDGFQDLTEHWSLLMGFFIIAVVLFLPNGIASLGGRAMALIGRFGKGGADPPKTGKAP